MQIIGPGLAEFSSFLPGRVVKVDLQGNGIRVEHNSFLFAEQGIQHTAALDKITVGWLGGLLMEHFTGQGSVFIHALGGVSSYVLNQGEEMEFEAGHVLAFDDNMQYSITRSGGIKTMLFGGLEKEGMFFVKLSGPGRVWLHNVSLEQLISKLRLVGGGGGGGPSQGTPDINIGGFNINI